MSRNLYSTKFIVLWCFVPYLLISCQEPQTAGSNPQTPPMEQTIPADNLLAGLNGESLNGFAWLNPPREMSYLENGLTIVAPAKSDYFNNPETHEITGNAPFFYREASGDFVATTLVQPDFSDMWNAVALMVYQDSAHWIKFAFENSDATGKSIVTVVTKGVSDDANGIRLAEAETVWLRLIRKGQAFSMLWSLDGEDFKMARLTTLPVGESLKVGVEAQCPVGESARHRIDYFSLESKTVEDMRKGI
jgi:regulation of enolase protein 1 (concanavalin A-like superfamily)